AVLHAAALMEKYPENAPSQRELAIPKIEALKELADQVERLQLAGPTLGPLPAPEPRIQRVLEELRADQAARAELAPPEATADPREEEQSISADTPIATGEDSALRVGRRT